MSYILDALKRNASDAQVGHAPDLHTQPVITAKVLNSSALWPALWGLSLVVVASLAALMQPWNRQPLEPEVIEAKVPEPLVVVQGEVNYASYGQRARVEVAAVRQPKPEVHDLPLPQDPVSAGAIDGKDELLEANRNLMQQDERLEGSQLEALFAQAVADSNQQNPLQPSMMDSSQAPPLTQKSQAFQELVPNMNFNTHSYSSDASKRMIKVNGVTLMEGGWIDGKVQVRAILPAEVVLEMQGELFSLPALSEW